MMNYEEIIGQRVQEIKPSGIRKFFDLLDGMENGISLGIGEPDFITPWHIRDAGIYALEKGYTKYTGNAGLVELRREICKYLERRFELSYDPMSEVIVTVGGSEGINIALQALLNPGEEVIVPVPSFVCYGPLTTMAGGVPHYLQLKAENQFRLTAEELKSAITPKTKVLVLPFPCNPTGGIMEREDLEAIAKVLEGTNIMVLSDEIYAELTYGQKHVSIANIPGMRERTVLINGFSKSHAMTGWRMGYVCAPAPVVRQMLKLHQFGIMSSPTTSQYAAIEALRNGDEDIARMREEYNGRRRFLVDGLRKLGFPCFEPKGAFYVFPDISGAGLSSDQFCEEFLRQEAVAIIPGTAFGPGGEGFARLCYATAMKDIAEALKRLERFVNTLK